MTVLGMRRGTEPVVGLDEQYTPDRLHEMLPRCDYLVITAPLTEQTRGMIGAKQLALLPPGAGLVNVGRGGIVDEHAVASAVAHGRLGGAFLDVFPEEPLPPDSPLWDTPGVVVTPHVAGERTDNNEAVADIWLRNLHRVVAGEEPRQRVEYVTKPATDQGLAPITIGAAR
jgi:phosphoglycerate dehydrogenase-like enzyme